MRNPLHFERSLQRPRNGDWEEYERLKRDFLTNHPEATEREIEVAFMKFADRLGL